jgi:uncharacterized protein (TIGR02246 family)
MRHLYRIAALTLVVTTWALGPAWGANASRTVPAKQEVRMLLHQYRQALVRRDVAALARLWSDDYTFTNPSGRLLSKKERLANFTSGATALGAIENEGDVQVRVYGNTAVVTSRATLNARYSGQESSGAYRSLHVWVKRGGRWQLVANQVTRIASSR